MKPRVLCVDDEPLLLRSIKRVLSRHYAVDTVGTAELALEVLESSPDIDLVITDIRMAGMSGVELLRALRQKGHPAVVLVLTGDPGSWSTDLEDELAVHAVLRKPMRALDLRREVANALAQVGGEL